MAFVKGSKSDELKKASFDELVAIFQKCHDEIWEGGKRDPATAFDEFSKLMMAKIYDERFTVVGEEYRFQIKAYETRVDVAEKVKTLYRMVMERNSNVFKVDIRLPERIVRDIVYLLQGISLRSTDLDAKGRAFESFLGKAFRDEYGQYFTPRSVVKFVVEFLDPDENDVIMDPACGSGGFLLYSLIHVIDKISRKYEEDKDSLNRIGWDFAHKQIFGVEINDRIARIAMMDMVIHEDGHSNIECNNALLGYDSFDKKKDIGQEKYSLVLTNPPFGSLVKDESILEIFELRRGSQKTEILFIERCLDLLREKGRLGIVLPDSILTNSTLQYVRDYILRNARVLGIVSLPQHTFVPSGAGVKSSLLFLEKLEGIGTSDIFEIPKEDYGVFMAVARHIGFDSRGKKDIDDLPEILHDWGIYNSAGTELSKAFVVNSSEIPDNFSPERFVSYNNKGWESRSLSELCDGVIFTGRTPSRNMYTQEGYKIIKVRDLTNKGMDWDRHERAFVSREFFLRNKDRELKQDDILIITAAHHPKYIGQKVDIIDTIPQRYRDGLMCSAEIMILRVNPKYVDPYYILLFLKTEDGYSALQSCVRGQTAHIYPKDIKNIKIPMPPQEYMENMSVGLERMREFLRKKTQANEYYVENCNKLIGFMTGLEKTI